MAAARWMLGEADQRREQRDGVERISFSDCHDGVEVVEYFIDDMGHVWPGGINRLPARLVGKPSDKLNATDVIWSFFKSHPTSSSVAASLTNFVLRVVY